MRIAVIGAGYVGLTTAACLAEIGEHVFCAESNPEKLGALERGELPLFEPHLGDLIAKSRHAGRLEFGLTEDAVSACEVLFICVGTPLDENGEVDVSAVEQVASTVSRCAHGYRLIIQKSTVPVGSCSELNELLSSSRSPANGSAAFHWDVVANPEFLREGSAIQDFLHPDRIVIGAENNAAAEAVREIYRPIIERGFNCPVHGVRHANEQPVPVVIADTQSAELIKHTANSFLAMKISFINMVADLCEAVGGDVQKVVEGIGLDHRIGPAFLKPGIGFGGSCFPKDVQGFIQVAEKFGCDFSLLKEVEKINQNRVDRFVAKVKEALGGLRRKKLGVWGLAFKPNTDDIRNSPAIAIVRRLIAEGAEIQAYDPQAMKNAGRELPEAHYRADAYAAAAGSDALLVLTDWAEFLDCQWDRVRAIMQHPLVIDGRNMFSPAALAQHGFLPARTSDAEELQETPAAAVKASH
ncbi:MAG: UDP-glucose/GDP-mannose dehydrogenase family protein [Acidobacteriota bacterium]|nr:UDP-glucose/GDP-mannose dehydrogenase family protein [Acidobacteriota bacterium]